MNAITQFLAIEGMYMSCPYVTLQRPRRWSLTFTQQGARV